MSALVNGKVRHSFIVIQEKVYFQKDDDSRSCLDTVVAEGMMSAGEFSRALRGCYDENGVYFFIGEEYRACKSSMIPVNVHKAVYEEYCQRYKYHFCDIAVWTGMEIGEVGTLWRPRKLIGVYTPQGEFVRN